MKAKNEVEKRKKILFITSWYPTKEKPYSGIFVKRYVDSLKNFCRINVFHPIPIVNLTEKKLEEISTQDGVSVYDLFYRVNEGNSSFQKFLNILNGYLIQYQALKKVLNSFGIPDLIHVQVIYPFGWLALLLFYTRKIPYIITEHWTGYASTSGEYKGKLRKFLTKKIVKNASCITTVSSSLSKEMQDHGLKNNYFIVPNVVNCKYVKNNAIRNDKINFLTVGNLKDKHKNISGIIKAIKNIEKIRKDFHLTIIGDGEDRKFLEDLTKSLQISKYVTFTGQVTDDQLSKYFAQSKFFVMNSNYETFSVVTAEALGYGLPVIITKCGGPEEFVKDNMGIIIETKNQEKLEKAILFMMDNYQNYERKYLNQYAKSLFSPEKIGEKFSKLYNRILTQN